MESSLVVQTALRAATIRHIGPYQAISGAFARLEDAATGAGLFGPRSLLVAIYYDDPQTTPGPTLRSDGGLVVEPNVALPPSLAETWIPAGRYVQSRHTGSYEGLPAAWASLRGEGMRQRNLQRRPSPSPSYELYINNPTNASPEDLITDIYIPVV